MPYSDGPYLVRGPITLRDQYGREIEAGRRTVALCRCGKSRLRPFCDGSHHLIRFRAPSGRETRDADRPPPRRPIAGAAPADRTPSTHHGDADGTEGALAAVDRDLDRLRRRLVAISQDGLAPGARAAVADASRSLAAASALLQEGLPGPDPETSR